MTDFLGDYYIYKDGLVSFQKTVIDQPVLSAPWQKCIFSFLSTGTELWQIIQKEKIYYGGYMSVGKDENYIVSPTPHGAFFNRHNSSNLIVNYHLNIYEVCLARFQLIAASSLLNSSMSKTAGNQVSIIGSGPVAISTAFEFLRQGFNVRVITKRVDTLMDILKEHNIQMVNMSKCNLDDIVVDCIGTQDSLQYIVENAVPGTKIGLLGSPRQVFEMDFYKIHKKGLSLIGLHELNSVTAITRQALFDDICNWIKQSLTISSSMFKIYKGDDFLNTMNTLQSQRPIQPFVIFKW